MIGPLLYLTMSRLDIMFSVCLYAKFRNKPREVHLSIIKCIFRYLIGSLCFKKKKAYRLLGYCDVNFAGDKVERKSTSRGCHFIGGFLVSWTNKKQGTIALSITKAELYQLQVVVLNSCGSNISLRITTCLRVKFLSFVIILLP